MTAVFALFGCAIFALPVGTVSSGLALEAAKRKRKVSEEDMQEIAAMYIQRWWRALRIYDEYQVFRQLSMFDVYDNQNSAPNIIEAVPNGDAKAVVENGETSVAVITKGDTGEANDHMGSTDTAISDSQGHPMKQLCSDVARVTMIPTQMYKLERLSLIEFYALFFIYRFKEIEAGKKFLRSKKTYISKEEVILHMRVIKLREMSRIEAAEVQYREAQRVSDQMDELIDVMKKVKGIAKQLLSDFDDDVTKSCSDEIEDDFYPTYTVPDM